GQPGAGRFRARRTCQRVPDALHALIVVGGRRTAGLDADGAAARLDLLGELREVHADLIVVRAHIGEAQPLVLRQEIAVPGKHRNARSLRTLERLAHGRRVRWRYGNAVDLLGDEVVDDLDLLFAAAMLARTDIEALDRAGEFLFRLLAAGQRLVEERVVHILGNEGENVFFRRGIGVVTHGEDCNRCNRRTQQFPKHSYTSLA